MNQSEVETLKQLLSNTGILSYVHTYRDEFICMVYALEYDYKKDDLNKKYVIDKTHSIDTAIKLIKKSLMEQKKYFESKLNIIDKGLSIFECGKNENI